MSRAPAATPAWPVAAALSLGAAVSLGLARFSYALLLPPMREDLGWTWLTAGAMNTVNAAGYFAGALALGALLARHPARRLFLVGIGVTAASLAAHGLAASTPVLYALRAVTGIGSALTFACGGLLAARLAERDARGAGVVLGVYYGGTGLGIVASALVVPWLSARPVAHAWQAAWVALGVLALAAGAAAAPVLRGLGDPSVRTMSSGSFPTRRYTAALASYFAFGVGYIGYMTFIVSLLRGSGIGPVAVTAFFVVLGLAVVASSWLWAWLLQRAEAGGALALLNGLLAIATLLPVLSATPVAAFVSGALFGGVFLSVVASTTALVRRRAPPSQWASGIAAFTAVFAFGQIVGPSFVGALSDAAGGLRTGFAVSAAVLACAAAVALLQRPVAPTADPMPPSR